RMTSSVALSQPRLRDSTPLDLTVKRVLGEIRESLIPKEPLVPPVPQLMPYPIEIACSYRVSIACACLLPSFMLASAKNESLSHLRLVPAVVTVTVRFTRRASSV